MNVYKIPVKGYFEVNSYFLIDEDTGHGFLIDPGAQGEVLVSIIKQKVWTIEKILLTHGHFDHTGGIRALQRALDIPVFIHENGATYLSDTRLNLSAWCGERVVVNGAHYIQDGAAFFLACHASPVLTAIHTPGHTPDSTTFYDAEDGIAFVSRSVSPAVNHRTDAYGGSTSNRARILLEILAGIHACAPRLHITAKVNSSDFTYGGLGEDESLEICKLLAMTGIDSIEVSGNSTSVSGIRAHVNEGYFVPFAARLAEEVDVPVIAVGGFLALDTVEAVLNQTKVELISLSRPLLCEPDLPNRMQADPATVSRCISCNRCYSSEAHKCVTRKHLK